MATTTTTTTTTLGSDIQQLTGWREIRYVRANSRYSIPMTCLQSPETDQEAPRCIFPLHCSSVQFRWFRSKCSCGSFTSITQITLLFFLDLGDLGLYLLICSSHKIIYSRLFMWSTQINVLLFLLSTLISVSFFSLFFLSVIDNVSFSCLCGSR